MEPADASLGFAALIESGSLGLSATPPEGGVSGRILDLTLTNATDNDMTVIVPCGLVLTPDEGELQRMIAVQSGPEPGESSVLEPGGVTVLTPYVMCIDSELPGAAAGSVYGIGEMASDELLALATCVCERDLAAELDPAVGDLGLQMAVWAAVEGNLPDLGGDLTQASGALGETIGGDLGIDLAELEELTGIEGFDLGAVLAQATQFMDEYQVSASTWLDECGIELSE